MEDATDANYDELPRATPLFERSRWILADAMRIGWCTGAQPSAVSRRCDASARLAPICLDRSVPAKGGAVA
jgi:hypothetical protein